MARYADARSHCVTSRARLCARYTDDGALIKHYQQRTQRSTQYFATLPPTAALYFATPLRRMIFRLMFEA